MERAMEDQGNRAGNQGIKAGFWADERSAVLMIGEISPRGALRVFGVALWFAILAGILLLGAARRAGADPIGTNLVRNGGFEAGNVGFGSSYSYRTAGINDMWDAGTYTIADSALNNHALWETGGDHTSGDGLFFLGNGRTDKADTLVWAQMVGVEQHTSYYFEAFAKNLCCATLVRPSADLLFYINGELVGGGPIDGPGHWQGISTTWNSGVMGRALLEIRNGSTVASGNDFGLDDIWLGTESNVAPEPASLVLLGSTLLGGAGWLKRRQRRQG